MSIFKSAFGYIATRTIGQDLINLRSDHSSLLSRVLSVPRTPCSFALHGCSPAQVLGLLREQQRTAAAPSTHAQDWPGEQDKATSLTSTQTRPSPQASRGSSCPPTSASTFSHYNPAFCSVDRVVGLIREAGVKASGRMQLRPAAGAGEEVKYNYVEDEEADLFFTPYLWSQVVVHAQETAKVSWNSQRLLLFDICK